MRIIHISRYYRNRRLGEFLKELDLSEGHSTGIPTIQDELGKNGSPRAEFFTDDDRRATRIRIPIHPAFLTENNLDVGETEKATKKASNKGNAFCKKFDSLLQFPKLCRCRDLAAKIISIFLRNAANGHFRD